MVARRARAAPVGRYGVAITANFIASTPEDMLHRSDVPSRELCRPLYPAASEEKWIAGDGSSITFRPIRPEDEPKMVRFHESLSDRSVYLRYFHFLSLDTRVTHERLSHICFIDNRREMVLVAESANADIIAVGRLSREQSSPLEAEFALLVSDAWHGHGLGTELLRRLISLARDGEIHRLCGEILPENDAMQKVCRKLGFKLRYSLNDHVVKAAIAIG
jgi:acetyltransferase